MAVATAASSAVMLRDIDPACTIRWATAATCGPERSPIETSDEPGETEFPQVRHHFMQICEVVRGGVEPPTFAFQVNHAERCADLRKR
jgi:hypothetical protein